MQWYPMFWLWLGAMLLPAATWAMPLGVEDGVGHSAPFANLAVLEDADGTLSVAAVSSSPHALRFTPLARPALAGHTGVRWIRFTASRAAAAPDGWLLQVKPPRLDAVRLFTPDERGGFSSVSIGNRLPYGDRPVPDWQLMLPVTLETTDRTFFLRIESGAPNAVLLDLWQAGSVEGIRARERLLTGIMLGSIGTMVMLNLVFSVWMRDRLYAHFVLFLVTACVLTLFTRGAMAEWLAPWPDAAVRGLGAAECAFNAAAASFTVRLFELERHVRWAARWFGAATVFNLAALLVALAGHHDLLSGVRGVLRLFSPALGAAVVCYLIGVRRQLQYLVPAAAFSIGTLAGIAAALQQFVDLAVPVPIDEIQRIGTLTSLWALSIALVNRTRSAERDVRLERQRALDVARRSEQELESKVTQRTFELRRSNESLLHEMAQRSALEERLRVSLQAERQALAQQKEFVAMVSHEFRTPLSIIDATAQSLDMSPIAQTPELKPRTTKIRRAVQRLTLLIENVLARDWLDAESRSSVRLEAFDLGAVVREIQAAMPDPSVLQVHMPPRDAPVEVEGDKALLEIALQNLVHNARKYSPAGSVVTIDLSTDGDMAHVEVGNQGEPIATGDQQRIFERYYRGKDQRGTAGSGLGLHIAREITRRHGGDVQLVASTPEGTMFRYSLPLRASLDGVPPHAS